MHRRILGFLVDLGFLVLLVRSNLELLQDLVNLVDLGFPVLLEGRQDQQLRWLRLGLPEDL